MSMNSDMIVAPSVFPVVRWPRATAVRRAVTSTLRLPGGHMGGRYPSWETPVPTYPLVHPAAPAGQRDRLTTVVHAEFDQHRADVVLRRPSRDAQCRSNFSIRSTGRETLQHFC